MIDEARPDPLGDVINLLAAPIAGGLRTLEQMKRGVDELFRAVDNLNRTMENLNEAAERVNRFMADVEEPVRVMIPQLTRTVRVADELIDLVEAPVRTMAPNLGRVAETLGSPAMASLPHRLDEFITMMGDVSRRLSPLTQLAESAGGMFGLRLPGVTRTAAGQSPATHPAPASTHEPSRPAVTSASLPTTSTRKTATKKAATKKTATKKKTAKKTPSRKSATKASPPARSGR